MIESGLVSSSVRAGAETREADRYHSGQCFGVEGALNTQVRVESTRAFMNTVAWRLNSKSFHELLEAEPRIAIKTAQQISQSVTRVLSGYQNPRALETNVYAIFVENENPEAREVALAVIPELRAGTTGVVQVVSVCDSIAQDDLAATGPLPDKSASESQSEAPEFFDTLGIFALGVPTRGMGRLAGAATRIARRLLGRTLSFVFGGGARTWVSCRCSQRTGPTRTKSPGPPWARL